MNQGTHAGIETAEKILIVDDDRDTCQLLQFLFQRVGYHAMVATSGRQALDQVQSEPPNLVVLDVLMPEMDGLETFRRMRELSTAPVLFLTALASGEYAAQALQLGAVDYLRKPFSNVELLVRVETALARVKNGANGLKSKLDHSPPMVSPAVVAIIPAYNEEHSIGSVVLRVRKFASNVIVVDDGSMDATGEVAQAAGAVVVRHEHNKGYGAAIDTAFATARELKADALVLIDADGQHVPEQIPAIIEPILEGRADMVVGSRYMEKLSNVPFLVKKAHALITKMTNAGSGINLSDSQCGYRAFSWNVVMDTQIAASGMTAASEFQFLAKQFGWRIEEVPVTILYNGNGSGKRNQIMHGLEVVNGIMHLIGQARPLLFFGVPGALGSFIGLLLGIRVLEIYSKSHTLAVGSSIVSALLILVGILAMFTAIILNTLRIWFSDLVGRFSPRR